MSRRWTSEEYAEDLIDTIGVAVVKMVDISFTLKSPVALTNEMIRRRLAKTPFPYAELVDGYEYDGHAWNYHFHCN